MADREHPITDDTARLRALFNAQHAASRLGAIAAVGIRRDRLDRLKALVSTNAEAFADAISADFGTRSRTESKLMEIVPTLGAIRSARKHVAGWLKPERRRVDPMFQPAKAWVRHEPLGVIGIISPWNYPLQLAISPLVDALAAGNRAMLKPSELTPAFADLLQRCVAERFDADEVVVVPGGVETGKAFADLPFDHLLFTGSTAVGRQVYLAAARNLTPVTLELGGKSPAIVCDDYPIEKAARSIVFGKFVNAGQTCIAPDYVLVPEAKAEAFAQALLAQIRVAYPTIAANPDYSGVISERHRQRLNGAIEAARREGATVLSHADVGASEAGKVAPTLVLGGSEDLLVRTEEIFGPVLPILTYREESEAIATVNRHERPLAMYIFTQSTATQWRLLDQAISGGVTINGTLMHIAQESLPFGGVGPSGIGAYHGEEGFKRFSHARAIHKIGAVNVLERLGPPWGKTAALVARMMLKR
jgi:coniferyl-aldehyde dehydrogenase